MPSGKNLEKILTPTLCFGDISRDEINTVLNNAGVSLTPPKKTPFATGIQRKKRPVVVVVNTPVFVEPKQQEYRRKFETVFVEPEEGDDDIPRATEATLIIAEDGKPVHRKIVEEQEKLKQQQEEKQKQQQEEKKQPITTKKSEEKKAEQKKEPTAAAAAAKPTKEHQQQQPQQKQQQSKSAPAAKKEPATSTTTTTTTTTAVNGTKTASSVETPAAEPATPQPAAKPVPFSWASLVKKPNEPVNKPRAAANASSPAGTAPMANGKQPYKPAKSANAAAAPSAAPKFTGVADIISKYEPNYKAPLIQPRGLINNVNTCFMNVILQPLLHCAPFYNLVKTISNQTAQTLKSKTPLLDSIIEFINEFQTERLDNNLEPYGEPFVPEYVYNALRNQKKFDTLRGRQEDSEEFLCFLLDGLHEEMTTVLKEQKDKKEAELALAAASATTNGEGNDWLEVGAKNKTSNLRSTGFDESPISKIFCGKLRSVLRCPGAKDSINQEPYQSLPLDIQPENVHTVEDAIANMTIPETMHDYTSPKGLKVDATKQVYLEGLPPVLILHMKRFVFDNVGGVQKLSKQVKYGSKLVIDPEWMVPASRSHHEPITYQLFGCVYHHGNSAGGGHYTCDIKRRSGEWLHIDDTTITSVSEQDVLVTEENTRTSEKLHAGQTAYILFYVRSS